MHPFIAVRLKAIRFTADKESGIRLFSLILHSEHAGIRRNIPMPVEHELNNTPAGPY